MFSYLTKLKSIEHSCRARQPLWIFGTKTRKYSWNLCALLLDPTAALEPQKFRMLQFFRHLIPDACRCTEATEMVVIKMFYLQDTELLQPSVQVSLVLQEDQCDALMRVITAVAELSSSSARS